MKFHLQDHWSTEAPRRNPLSLPRDLLLLVEVSEAATRGALVVLHSRAQASLM